MKTIDWSSFTKKININVSKAQVYKSWTTPKEICTWFLKEAIYKDVNDHERSTYDTIQQNDSYTWKWHNWDGEEKGTILKANGTDCLIFSFAGEAKVEIKLLEKDMQTSVVLTQSNIPTDEESKFNIYCGCSNGWTFWLANLKAYLEHGILLHETNLESLDGKSDCNEYVNV